MRLRSNTSNNSNEASGSYSRLHLNTTPHPNRSNNTPPSTPRSNNTYTRFNDNDDVFHLNPHPTPWSNTRINYNDIFHSNTTNMFRRTSESNQSILPATFSNMSNVHQICSWLCENTSILLLAYNMHLSMQTPVANAFNLNFNSSTLATGVAQMPKQEDRVSVGCVAIIYFSLVNVINCDNLYNLDKGES